MYGMKSQGLQRWQCHAISFLHVAFNETKHVYKPYFPYPRWKEKKKKKNHNPSKKLSLSFTVQFKLEKETAPDKVQSDYFVP